MKLSTVMVENTSKSISTNQIDLVSRLKPHYCIVEKETFFMTCCPPTYGLTVNTDIVVGVVLRNAGGPDLVGEGELLLELEDGKVHVGGVGVVVDVLVQRPRGDPPFAAHVLDIHYSGHWRTLMKLEYTQYVLEGTGYKGQNNRLVKIWNKPRLF